MLKEKIQKIFKDERSAKQRGIVSALMAFAYAFTFVYFGITDLYVSNKGTFVFSYGEILVPIVLATIFSFVFIFGCIFLFKGVLFDCMMSVLLGILVSGYIQGNFLNLSFGELTGDRIQWQYYSKHAIVNTLIWIAISMLFVIIYYFSKAVWEKLLIFIPVIMIGMQLSALVVSFATVDFFEEVKHDRYLSVDGIYELSSKDNIIVFILDRLDTKYIDQVVEDTPDFFDRLEGFAYYSNFTSKFCRTYPSVAYMLTGEVSLFDRPAKDFFEEAYEKAEFLPLLQENNYATKLYMEINYTYSDIDQLDGIADNIAEGEQKFKPKAALKRLVQLSAYRYAPHVFKPSFWLSTDEFSELYDVKQEPKAYTTDDYGFYNDLMEQKLSVSSDSERGNFMLIHLNGSHAPYNLNEYLQRVPESETSMVQQTKGAFEIVYEYMEQMKKLGLYEDATIIITGDHPRSENEVDLDKYKTTAFYLKPSGKSNERFEEVNIPASHDNFRATILDAAGIEPIGDEKSMFDLDEDTDDIRRFYYQVDAVGKKKAHLEEFIIRGDARDFSNWEKVDEHPILYTK